LTLKLVRETFSKPGSTKVEVDEILIHFNSNKSAFIKMLNCLDITEDEELILDLPKMKELNALGARS
jgi:uncharacterized protein YjgD (DUF1641 family)